MAFILKSTTPQQSKELNGCMNLLLGILLFCAPVSAYAAEEPFLFGVGTHFAHYKNRASGAATLLKHSGFNTYRDELQWRVVEKTKGYFQIPPERSLQGELLGGSKPIDKLSPLLLLAYGSPLTPEFPTTVSSLQAFGNYCGFMAARFSNIKMFEVWNEWNIGFGLGGRASPYRSVKYYAAAFEQCAKRIKANNPNAKILTAGLGDRDNDWLDELMRTRASQLADGVALHPYNFSEKDRATPENALAYIKKAQIVINLATKRNVPIYITEFGWPTSSSRPGVSLNKQASLLVNFSLLARTISQVKGVWLYDLVDDGPDATNIEHNFGLTKRNLEAKPSFVQLACLTPMLIAGSDFAEAETKTGLTGVSFTYDKMNYLAVWNNGSNPLNLNIKSTDLNLKYGDICAASKNLWSTIHDKKILSIADRNVILFRTLNSKDPWRDIIN